MSTTDGDPTPLPPTPLPPTQLPLTDVRILAVEQYGAGPFGTLHLAELGAEVIKVEDPHAGGDVGRYVPPFQDGEDSLFFESLNRNKRSVSLDLRNPAGREVFGDLVRVCDAVYSNLRGDGPARLGLRYADLREHNPRIVCCSLSGFGTDGPRAAEPAYDFMVQALAGWMSITGEPDSPPVKAGPSVVDFASGFAAALALVAGVHAARRDGVGRDCDVSMFEVALSMLSYQATWHLTRGYEPVRTPDSAHPSIVPFQNLPTSDGWVVVCCPKQKFYEALCDVLGRPDLATNDDYADFAARYAHRDALVAELRAEMRRRPTAAWVRDLTAAGVPVAPVNTVAEALRDPQAQAREAVVTVDHPGFGPVGHVRSPVRAGDPPAAQRHAPERGEDTARVVTELLGYAPQRREELAAEGAFGAPE